MRADLLRRRKSLPHSLRLEKSALILRALLLQEAFVRASGVGLYFPVNGEVDTRGIFAECLSLGKKVFFPKTLDSGLVFARAESTGDLSPGPFSVPEPAQDAERARSGELDLVLVPGVAFDSGGNRIGYGKGFYDRFLKDMPRRARFALAYRFQLLESVPSGSADLRVGRIVTEDGAVDCLGQGEN